MGHSCTQPPKIQHKESFHIESLQGLDQQSPIQLQNAEQFDNPMRPILETRFLNTQVSVSSRLFHKHKSDPVAEKETDMATSSKRKKGARPSIQIGLPILYLKDQTVNISKKKSSTRDNITSYASVDLKQFIKVRKDDVGNHYDFEEEIGSGTFGKVFKAIQKKTGELRAIKFIKSNKVKPSKKEELLVEFDILRQMDHPNIIKLYQVFINNKNYYVVTEYCVGGSALEFITNSTNYTESHVREIMRQLLGAVRYIHNMNYVHRDIKLENMLFLNKFNENSPSTDINLKIIDFGSATELKKPKNSCPTLVGTLSYISPEVIRGFFTTKSDVWGCGVTLHVLLVGKSPFKAKKKDETIRNILSTELTFEGQEWKQISSACINFLKQMLTKNCGQRASVQELFEHSWLKDCRIRKTLICMDSLLLSNLKEYYRSNNFVSVIESYLAFAKISQQERKRITDLFVEVDLNNDGKIEKKELEIFLGDDMDGDIEDIVNCIDKNRSGTIDLSEFIVALSNKRNLFVKQFLLDAFEEFDANQNGYIEKEELDDILKGCSAEEFHEIFEELDTNHDNKISKEEFLNYMLSYQQKIE